MQEEILQEAQLHAAVAEIADRTAYNALVSSPQWQYSPMFAGTFWKQKGHWSRKRDI